MSHRAWIWASVAVSVLISGWGVNSGVAVADIVVLQGGGRIVGQIVAPSPNEKDESVTVQTEDSALISVPKSEVKEIIRLGDVQAEYQKLRREIADTVEDHWKMAEWCRDHNLTKERQVHLKRIIELDPEHQRARALLGYQKIGGEWKTREEIMKSMGYVLYKGRWMLPQQVQLEQEREQQTTVQREWSLRIHRLLVALETDPITAQREIKAIHDPAAVKPLILAMKNECRDAVRLLLTEVLGQIGTPEAARALAILAIEDPVEEVRLHALEAIAPLKSGEIVNYFVGRLHDKNNVIVNRAGDALKKMGDLSAIPALIDALVTRHKIFIPGTRPPTGMAAGFSSSSTGKSGMSFGAGSGGDSSKVVERAIPNPAVLEALVELSGGQNFGYDVRLWKQWYAQQKREEAVRVVQ
ncbi:MAG: HEAT repeat domain-containing protein [Thermogutta sp.]